MNCLSYVNHVAQVSGFPPFLVSITEIHKHNLWAKFDMLTLFVNKYYWNMATPTHLCIVYGCFHPPKTAVTDYMTRNSKIFTV